MKSILGASAIWAGVLFVPFLMVEGLRFPRECEGALGGAALETCRNSVRRLDALPTILWEPLAWLALVVLLGAMTSYLGVRRRRNT